jgi:hypothetical protein
MIEHYLPNNNENVTVPILPKILELNWANAREEDASETCVQTA